jgi:hypothetical protein
MGDQHAMGRAIGHRKRCRVLEGDVRRHGDQLVGSHQTILRHTAVEHFAHQSLFLVERIDQHAIAGLPRRRAAADLGDFTSDVEPDHHRQRDLDARHAAHGEHVMVVERRRPHPDHNMTVRRPRHRVVVDHFQVGKSAMPAQHKRFHRGPVHARSPCRPGVLTHRGWNMPSQFEGWPHCVHAHTGDLVAQARIAPLSGAG